MPEVPTEDPRYMELKRRHFIGLLLTAFAGLLAAGRWLAREADPRRILLARRTRRYPGPVRELDRANLRKPARWEG